MHTTGFDPAHVPDTHSSVCVQPLKSVQELPSGFSGFEHTPVAGAQVPARWQLLIAEQITGLPPLHTPAWQVSDCVQAFPSEHAVPLGLAGFEQTPVAGPQVPAE